MFGDEADGGGLSPFPRPRSLEWPLSPQARTADTRVLYQEMRMLQRAFRCSACYIA